MPSKPQKLPIGIQSFEIIQEQNYLYVDKTADIYRMVDEGMFYFLSRPRRFGKSLLVSTLQCLFQGRRDLFEGLWVEQQTDWGWKPHPVILLDFNQIPHTPPRTLEQGISVILAQIAQIHGLSLKTKFIETQLQELILQLNQQTQQKVVVLIDEYDKTIIDHLGKGESALEIAKANREILKSFFGVLKGGDIAPRLRFVLLTGISKFSKVSIFSELNNLEDISMVGSFSTMLGYTFEELTHHFQDSLKKFMEAYACSYEDVLDKLIEHYNGYRFSKAPQRVFNPFSILNACKQLEFGNYWFESGTPSFLINLLKENQYPLPTIENLELDEESFRMYDIEQLRPEAILFQTGYITIQNIEDGLFTLGYPNQEVKQSFLKHLFFALSEVAQGVSSSWILKLSRYLQQENLDLFFKTITSLFAAIPYVLNAKRDEAYFHTLFYLMVSASGINTRCEILTSQGRIDLEIEFPEKVYLIEFKCTQSAQMAIQQIQKKGYADKYKGSSKKVILLGINFSSEARNVEEWEVCS